MEEKKVSNNLFDYATKELSQDAFICWLVSWINHKNENKELYNIAYKFFEYIFESKNLEEKDFKIKKILRQEKHCDILIILENGYYIIIEDKTYSSEHEAGKSGKNQIDLYKEEIYKRYSKQDKGLKQEKIITVFYKIFDYDELSTNADVNITRKIMLKLLDKNIDNDIYNDYKNKLLNMQDIINKIQEIPVVEWYKKKELIYYFFEHESIFKKYKNGERNAVIENTQGSIFIMWDFKQISSKAIFGTKMDFGMIHLALDINYDNANIFIKAVQGVDSDKRGQGIKDYNKEERKFIQEKLEKILEQKLKKQCFIKHTLTKGSKSFRLVTINLEKLCNKKNEEIMLSDLENALQKVTKAYNEIIDDKN